MTEPKPIRVAIVGDTHADDSSRFEQHNEIMAWIADDAAKRGCCVMLHAGDVFERRSTPRERLAVVDWMGRVTRHGMSLVMVAGNHDDPLDIELLGRVRRMDADERVMIRTATRAESVLVSAPGFYDCLQVHCLPWPRKGSVAALLRESDLGIADALSAESLDLATTDALRNVLRGFGANRWSRSTPTIFLGHCMVRGSRTAVGQPPLVGQDFVLGVEDIALADADFYALGHIHLPQEWKTELGFPVCYTGSPRRCNFGEVEEKSYLVVTFETTADHRKTTWERIVTPAPPLYHVNGKYLPEHTEAGVLNPAAIMMAGDLPDSFGGGEVRLRYSVRAADREAARRGVAMMVEKMQARGAASVKVEEEVEVETRARAPEVAMATGTAAKLGAYWDRQTEPPDPELRRRLLDKLGTIEEAAS